MKQFVVVGFFILLSTCIQAQKKDYTFADRLVLGASFFYIPDWNDDFPELRHNERYYEFDAAVNLTSRWYVGLRHRQIFTDGSTVIGVPSRNENYNMTGIFGQYDLILDTKTKSRLFLEAAYSIGNYCSCGAGDPYKNSDLQ